MTQALVIAAAGFLSVGALTFTLGLLLSKKGRYKAIGFATGYLLTYILIGILFVSFFQDTVVASSSYTNQRSSWLFMIIGLFFITIGIHNIKTHSNKNKKSRLHKLLDTIDSLSIKQSFFIGLGIPLINVKSLLIYVSSLSVLPTQEITSLHAILAVLLISLVFCSIVIIPSLLAISIPHTSEPILKSFKIYLVNNSPRISRYIPFVIGILFLINALNNIISV